jgi:GMP synthase-like glutamine amidotransferase
MGSIERWLGGVGAHLTTTRFYEGRDLPDVDELDLLVIMGGPMSANDYARYPWLLAELRFIREAIENDVAVLGVCLGAQLIARAMGARVYPNAEREIGWFPITGLSADRRAPAWTAKGVDTTVFHWHGETFEAPQGARRLACSEGCDQQAFQIGERVIGIQFHLETTPALLEGLVSNCRAELTPSRFVQSESEIVSAEPARFAAINELMAQTLAWMTCTEEASPAQSL